MIKTFKIGEEAIGGIVKVSTRRRDVYEVSTYRTKDKVQVAWRFVYGLEELRDYCEEISTPYWADQIVSHFETKLEK
jgi:hypothetical protein